MADGGERNGLALRVLLVIKCLGYGGAERLLVDTVAAADRRVVDYQVAYVLSGEDALVPGLRAGGTPVHDLGAAQHWDPRWVGRLRRLLERGAFNVVHFHLPYTAAMGRLAVRSLPQARRPVVVYTEHSLWDHMAVVVRGLNRATIGGDQGLVVVSQAAYEALPEALRPRARVVVHGLDLSRSDAMVGRRPEIRAQVRAELGLAPGELLVMAVANLRAEKGYDVLLEAVHRVGATGLPARFFAVGRGPLEAALAARLDALAIGDRFRFLGQRDDVLRLLAGSDVFVLASRQEGMPLALMEATSVGLPMVVTAVGGVPRTVTDEKDALVVPPGDAAALAAALERLCSDAALRQRLGEGAQALSPAFDVGVASREIEALYLELCGRA